MTLWVMVTWYDIYLYNVLWRELWMYLKDTPTKKKKKRKKKQITEFFQTNSKQSLFIIRFPSIFSPFSTLSLHSTHCTPFSSCLLLQRKKVQRKQPPPGLLTPRGGLLRITPFQLRCGVLFLPIPSSYRCFWANPMCTKRPNFFWPWSNVERSLRL